MSDLWVHFEGPCLTSVALGGPSSALSQLVSRCSGLLKSQSPATNDISFRQDAPTGPSGQSKDFSIKAILITFDPAIRGWKFGKGKQEIGSANDYFFKAVLHQDGRLMISANRPGLQRFIDECADLLKKAERNPPQRDHYHFAAFFNLLSSDSNLEEIILYNNEIMEQG